MGKNEKEKGVTELNYVFLRNDVPTGDVGELNINRSYHSQLFGSDKESLDNKEQGHLGYVVGVDNGTLLRLFYVFPPEEREFNGDIHSQTKCELEKNPNEDNSFGFYYYDEKSGLTRWKRVVIPESFPVFTVVPQEYDWNDWE